MILYSLGVSLGGSLSAHAGQLATVRFLLRSALGSLSELLAGCSRRDLDLMFHHIDRSYTQYTAINGTGLSDVNWVYCLPPPVSPKK